MQIGALVTITEMPEYRGTPECPPPPFEALGLTVGSVGRVVLFAQNSEEAFVRFDADTQHGVRAGQVLQVWMPMNCLGDATPEHEG